MHSEKNESLEPVAVESRFRPRRWLMGLLCFILIGFYAGTVGMLGWYVEEESHYYPVWKGVEQAKDRIYEVQGKTANAWLDTLEGLKGELSEETFQKLEECIWGMGDVRETTDRGFHKVCVAFSDDQLRMNKVAATPLIVSAGAGGFVILLLAILLIAAARPATPVSDWEWQKKHYRKA